MKTEKRYIFKKSGSAINIGDEIDFGRVSVIVSESNIPLLIRYNIIEEVELNINDYAKRITDKLKLNSSIGNFFLASLTTVNPGVVFSLLLKEIAIEIDNRYEGHISKSPEIYCVSVLNGKIKKINKNNIHTYKHFAAFRTKEDALEAIRILKVLYQDMF